MSSSPEIPPLPPPLCRAPLPPALRVATGAAAHALGGAAHGELVPALPPDPHAHGLAAEQARRPFAAQRALARAAQRLSGEARALSARRDAPRRHDAAPR